MKYEKKFFAAARDEDVELINQALADGFPVDHFSKFSIDENFWATPGRTGLMWATIKGHPNVVAVLLAAGASPNARELVPNMEGFSDGHDFRSCWALAAEYNRCEIMQMLFKSASPPDAQHLVDCTEHAAKHGSLEVLEHLLDFGVKINSFSSDDLTPLMAAAGKGHAAVVEYLVRRGATVHLRDSGDVDDSNMYAGTALHHCILGLTFRPITYDSDGNIVAGPTTEDFLHCLRLLLDSGADPNSEQRGCEYPLARVVAYPKTVQMLLSAGADPNLNGDNGARTALH